MTAKDVEVDVTEDGVTISGERSYGRFERSFRLPESVDGERIAAAFENGVLTVTLPKTAESLTRSRRIQIAAKK